MKRPVLATLATLISCFCSPGLLTGCATTAALAPSTGWRPQSEQEMRQLIGETVMEAIYQYQEYMLQHPEVDPRLEPITEKDNRWL